MDSMMEAVSITNLTPALQASHFAAGTSSSDKPADSGSPSFAQVVRDILVRTTVQNDTQPAHTLQPGGAGSFTSQKANSTDSRVIPRASAQPIDPATFSLASLLIDSAVIPSASPVECPSQTNLQAASSGDSQSAAPSVPCDEAGPQPIYPLVASAGPASTHSSTQSPLLPPLPDLVIQRTADQLSASDFSAPSPLPNDKNVPLPDQLQTNPNRQPDNRPGSAKSISDILAPSCFSSSPSGVPLTSLQPLISQLQLAAPAAAATTSGLSVHAVHSTLAQVAIKVSLASSPLFPALPGTFAFPLCNGTNASPPPAIPPPVVLPSSA